MGTVCEHLLFIFIVLCDLRVLPTFAARAFDHVGLSEASAERGLVYVGIFSAAENKARRHAVRNSWLTHARLRLDADFIVGRAAIGGTDGLKVRQQGMVAGQYQLLLEKELADEERRYGDILRIPNLDVYSELPAKTLALFAYGVRRGYSFIVKVDDDQYFWPLQAWSFFRDRDPQTPLYAGNHLWESMVSDIQLGADGQFTPYFGGPCYALSLALASNIADENLPRSAAYEAYGSTSEDVDMGKWVNLSGLKVDFVTVELSSYELTPQSSALPPRSSLLHTPAVYRWPDFPLGNAYFHYWNARAMAIFKHSAFEAVDAPQHGAEILLHLPQKAHQVQPSDLQSKLFAKLARDVGACLTCGYPAESALAPWQLIMGTMALETQAIVRKLHPHASSFAADAVVHVRCDLRIISMHTDYGLLRHRFVADRLPPNVNHLVVVGTSEAFDVNNMCGKSTRDFQEYIRRRNVTVELRSHGTSLEDWLFLASAPLLFCSPSTFCASAAFGNPNQVFLPVNDHTSIRRPSLPVPCPRNLHWAQTDFLPGKLLQQVNWDNTRRYLRASNCTVSFCDPRAD
ncbi:GALT2 [Symbiodinium natans]|uniref:GALT2 protein n=1 Tax=Symbiodinium natans TaxID=878477 RepID=A0A812UY65_9DINO|nr:GALT2 [Symbiodinium natans]